MKRVLSLFSNKYFLSTTVFVVWMMFFDRNDLMSQAEYRAQLDKLKEERDFYIEETGRVKKDLEELTTNREKLEKFAREKYLMKKANEDVYVLIPEKDKEEDKTLF
ncbi:septum formation initiator [Arcticibacter tournemirensis]|uniref:Septum formation initiator family protein n=1 Tax=Arcticibacter tournemirensis TaxID=699437 RepID=A0A4Q0M5W8_9SPHI|nr:septum formation initiator family protein [Arcticibacter tournemirensis]KAA8482568.1 septum formation initiator family protein [Arcticibacter tournemirensis]RXF68421.1 septum formation initiator family protein [Arcticibacter tournemirensis]TQM52535.1 septum formation initiator [Arcticibacter tournemirensis]